MIDQKFQRGNRVKILFGHKVYTNNGVIDMHPEYVGREAVIIGSYADQYGGSERSKYTIIYCDNGNEMSWVEESQMELIHIGGEHMIDEAKEMADILLKLHTDIKSITRSWKDKGMNVSTDTILFLFDKIGFKSNFLSNGEYYSLFSDWQKMYNFFDFLFNAKTEEEERDRLTDNAPAQALERIIALFNEIMLAKDQTLSAPKLHESD